MASPDTDLYPRFSDIEIDRRSWSSNNWWTIGFDALGKRLRKNSGIAS